MLGLHFTPACILLSVCSLHFTPGPHSAVRSLRFTLTESGIPTIIGIRGVGGGELPYKSDGDARRKIKIKPLREINVSVA